MKHLFIVNPRSFGNSKKLEGVLSSIHHFFETRDDFRDYHVEFSRFPRDATAYIRSFADKLSANTHLRVYAVGGDGILFDCLNGVMGLENVSLGAMPFGNTNNFIRGFGRHKKHLFQDVLLQTSGPAVPMDVIHGGINYGLSFCTIGTESLTILKTLNIQEKLENGGAMGRLLGKVLYDKMYYAGGLAACCNKNILNQYYNVVLDGEDYSGNYRGITIFNGAFYGGEKHPIPSAMPNDGLLDILLARSSRFARTVVLAPAYVRGNHHKYPDFTLKRVKKIVIGSPEPVLVSLDDVVFFDTNFTVEILPAAVNFVDVTREGYQGVPANG